ncbi:MAG: GNAT family N-acetyltransferase [Cyclobacteriaceae bacterium]|nr:GNAT family N-acetyltransferase [Cyclobacteriaceae bacterium HetDA_MAG_MS6]
MIKKLQNDDLKIANQIYTVFQLSYAIEAELLGVNDFPPLKRPLESYLKSGNEFYGYLEHNELAGVIEVERKEKLIDINSLVVQPKYFRRGIGKKLIAFTFNRFDLNVFIVETGVKNTPAIELYKKLNFKEVKQWDTDFGIRKVLFERRINS